MFTLNKFADRSELDQVFADQIAKILINAIEINGKASIAVSGGSTPKGFFQALSQQALAWDKVTVTLADERWVDENSEASNTRLVKNHLLQNNAAAAHFFDLKISDNLDEQTLYQLKSQAKEQILPFDVLILGMGEDGHTASLFPCSDEIEQALSLQNNAELMSVQPKTAPHQRITFTLASLLKAKHIYLHLCGESKQKVLQQALAADDVFMMPIRAFLHHKRVDTQIMYAD
ncbi:MAG: 6-phosphogluconolactonase [Gammaproteobacteria bacterium]|nr:MAG: 6-phosphogluconolactonase [Gammaproteobacteria bacterium]